MMGATWGMSNETKPLPVKKKQTKKTTPTFKEGIQGKSPHGDETKKKVKVSMGQGKRKGGVEMLLRWGVSPRIVCFETGARETN